MSTPKQLAFVVSGLDALIEARAAQALAEIHAMAADAIEFINRSCGQKRRRIREHAEDLRDAVIARERLREGNFITVENQR